MLAFLFLYKADSTIFFVFLSVMLLVVLLSYYFSKKQKIIRILSKLPSKQIGNLKMNEFSKITGKALHVKEPLIAPLSKRKCVFYSIKIEQYTKSGKNGRWRTLINEEKVQEFFLDKSGDFVIVRPSQNPKNYLSYLVVDKKTNSGSFNNPTPEFQNLLQTYGIDSKSFFGFNKKLRYKEGVIEIGERITVAGIAKWKTLKEPIEGYGYSKIAELESSIHQKLIITDLPNTKSKQRR